VQFLGCHEQVSNPPSDPAETIYNTINQNWLFINRAHAYSIDPTVARRLFCMVLERGIFESLDVMINIDNIPVLQDGLYAYDDPGAVSTVADRKQAQDRGPGLIKI